MKSTYKAVQISQPGVLQLVERPVPTPASGEVLIDVEACGICGADKNDVDFVDPTIQPPRIPGHEVVGRISEVGPGVSSTWKVGQRVGVGRLGGHCNECNQCRQGYFHLCLQQKVLGVSCDGGYAEKMLAKATGLVAIPDSLSSAMAAPLLCAGIATFNALKKSGAQAGDLVAIFGIGGLGHLAIQYAKKMGFRVVAIGRGAHIEDDVRMLGAHIYINTDEVDAVSKLKSLGGAQVIMTTITNGEASSGLVAGLAPQGKLMVVGVSKDPLIIPAGPMVGGERMIQGAITGTPFESEKTLDFSLLTDVRPLIETMPLEQAPEAYKRAMSGQVTFRMVLTMKQPE